jgi:hypothetical protein
VVLRHRRVHVPRCLERLAQEEDNWQKEAKQMSAKEESLISTEGRSNEGAPKDSHVVVPCSSAAQAISEILRRVKHA